MAQIIQITSEALQATIRRLLPSQQGFGEDLQASNVIQPIIDLTPTAEGSSVREDLQTALGFADITAFRVNNSSSVIANTPGFYRIHGNVSIYSGNSTNNAASLQFSDGLSTKNLFQTETVATPAVTAYDYMFDFVAFLTAGDSITAVSNDTQARMNGVIRQIADVNGVLSNPTGFNPQ